MNFLQLKSISHGWFQLKNHKVFKKKTLFTKYIENEK